jgi:hypothetical protein
LEPERRDGSSLCDVAHDGVLCTFSLRTTLDRGKWYRPSGQAAWTVHHVQSHTLPARRAAVLGQPSSLQPLWLEQSYSRTLLCCCYCWTQSTIYLLGLSHVKLLFIDVINCFSVGHLCCSPVGHSCRTVLQCLNETKHVLFPLGTCIMFLLVTTIVVFLLDTHVTVGHNKWVQLQNVASRKVNVT